MLKRLNEYFDRRKEYAAIFFRLILGWRLIYGTADNVFSNERMLEFRDFLEAHNVLLPLFAAYLSVYVQFIAGILLVIGALVRPAAILLIINFVAAILIVHIGDTFLNTFDALVLLFGGLFFLFHGAGKLSVDEYLERKR